MSAAFICWALVALVAIPLVCRLVSWMNRLSGRAQERVTYAALALALVALALQFLLFVRFQATAHDIQEQSRELSERKAGIQYEGDGSDEKP